MVARYVPIRLLILGTLTSSARLEKSSGVSSARRPSDSASVWTTGPTSARPRTTLVRTGISPHATSSVAGGAGGMTVGEKSHWGGGGGRGGSLEVEGGGDRGRAERLAGGSTEEKGEPGISSTMPLAEREQG